MRDYRLDGVPVALLPIADIEDCLRDPESNLKPTSEDGTVTLSAFLDRLRIELLIRSLNL